MMRVALSVMLVSGGLAAIARATQIPHAGIARALLFAVGAGAALAGLIVMALDRVRRAEGRQRARRRAWAVAAGWDDAGELERLGDFGAAWDSPEQATESSASLSRARIREASRSLLHSFESEARETVRSRRAIRSACRRSHLRAAAASRPKRHRVKPRARLFM